MPEGFAPGRGGLGTRDPRVRFEMTQEGADFFQTAIRTTPAGVERSRARIALAYGAARADEVYFSWRGDRLYELPVVWLHPQKRWATAPYDRHGTGDFARQATTRCLECHNTWFEHVPGTPNQYRPDSFLLGVSCERCHGPGREHVAFHKAHPEADTGRAIINPGSLTRERLLEVCTQCHSNAIKRRAPAFSYRPGQPLANSFTILATRYPEEDHVANQVQYLRQSKCFQKSDSLTCITCHNPHRPEGPANTRAVQRSCLKCHQPAACGEQVRLPADVRGDCVGCHMPARVWMNVHFHTADDQFVPPIRRHEHRIAVYPKARQEVLLAWRRMRPDADSQAVAARLRRELVEHWLDESDRRQRNYRFLAAIGALREARRLDPAPATRQRLREVVATQARLDDGLVETVHHIDRGRFPEAIETLKKILAIKPDLAVAHAKLGRAYASVGQGELAREHLRAVARYDPSDPSGYTLLGWLAYLDGRAEEAALAYGQAAEIEPYNAQISYHLGLALAQFGRLREAVASFRRVLAIDPKHAGGCQGLSHTLRQQGEAKEAVRFGRRAARLTGFRNPDVLLTLAEAYAAADRPAEAEDTITRALKAVQASNPGLMPTIRRRGEEIRARLRDSR
jgi:Flp pilus assembly protein TadD